MYQQLPSQVYERVSVVIYRDKMALEKLHHRYPFAMVTNFYGNVRQVLREFELDDLFEDVIGPAVANIWKPDARLLRVVLDIL